MIVARFRFRPGEYDDRFHELNDKIDRAAAANPGFLGKERWQAADSEDRLVVYYWDSRQALEAFATHPDHEEAKRQWERWYDGYEVTIAEVSRQSSGGLFAESD